MTIGAPVFWRDVAGWPGFYQVSACGRVRSVDRRAPVVNRFGNIEMRLHRGKELKVQVAKNGYCMVSLTRPGAVRRYAYVHDLVAEAFLGPKPQGYEICHDNGCRTDNYVFNLRYDTRSRNALDRHAHGTMNQARGVVHYQAKLTPDAVHWIRQNAGVLSQRDMADLLGVTHSTVGLVVRGKGWKHVA